MIQIGPDDHRPWLTYPDGRRGVAGARPRARLAPLRSDARHPAAAGGRVGPRRPAPAGPGGGGPERADRRDVVLVVGRALVRASRAGRASARPAVPDEPRDVRRPDPRTGRDAGLDPGRDHPGTAA